ncbi:hypothetical protein [Bradyrhizobium elkanii]|uniref:hypothetical protein n=1 Tax=Bradyrhizobium elkanii TaxID=29448 RepID=UPI00056EE5B0|nr:hypothetical protein [Bradyrhizobium elkanii]
MRQASRCRHRLRTNTSEIYRQRVAALYESLQAEGETAEVFQTLINQVTLVPEAEELAIVLRGDLAAILRFAAVNKSPDFLWPGLWMVCYRKHRWLRGGATPDYCD